MSEKKVVSRNITIGLGVICIVLVVALVVMKFDYESTLNNKDSNIISLSEQNDSLNSQIESYNSTIASLNSQISSLQNQSSSLSSQNTNLQNQVNSLNSQITDLNSQINTLNAEVNNQTIVISEMLLQLNSKYDTTNTDGIYILNYSMTYGQAGLSQTYTADITLYNALSTATVTIKLYGSDSKLFTYEMPTGSTLHRVENWTGDIWARNFDNIVVESVVR